MLALMVIFTLLFALSLAALILGLAKPELILRRVGMTRYRAGLICGIAALVATLSVVTARAAIFLPLEITGEVPPVTQAPAVDLRGKTRPGAELWVNDSDFSRAVDEETGEFRIHCPLKLGENEIVFRVYGKRGSRIKKVSIRRDLPRAVLAGPDTAERDKVIRDLVEEMDPEVIAALWDLAQKGPDAPRCREALERVKGILMEVAEENPGRRDSAVEALVRIKKDAQVASLMSELLADPNLKPKAKKYLVDFGGPAAVLLASKLGEQGADAPREVLVEMGGPAVQPLLDVLKKGERPAKLDAARTLVKIYHRDPGAVSYLYPQAVKVNDYRTISQTYMFYIYLGKKDCEGPLIEALNRHGDKAMGVDYLNCGNERLDDAARAWGRRHGYTVVTRPGVSHKGPVWGGA